MQLAASIGTIQHFIQAFSWMLIHSLWQGMLLALVTALILMLTKASRPIVRYNLVFVQFALLLVACGTTFIYEWNKLPLNTGLTGSRANGSVLLFDINIAGFARTCMNYFTVNAPFIVLLWFVLFLFRAIRVMGDLVYIHRARHRFVYQPSVEWKTKFDLLCNKLKLSRTVQLLESGYVKVPMVIGHLKPLILIPVGLLAGLPSGQVEAVLLHELAHIRRNDYVVNFIQTVTETIFFFNPGLLWISSLLRDERENCCDDVALDQTKNKLEFIEALISFKEHTLFAARYEVAFPGKKNHLLNRVSRILNNRNKTLAPGEKIFFMAGVIVLSALIATAAIAKMHTMVSKRQKAASAVAASAPAKTTANSKQTIAIEAGSTKRKAHLSTRPSTGLISQSSKPQAAVSEANDLDKVHDTPETDQAGLSSIVNMQIDRQRQEEQNRRSEKQARVYLVQQNIEQAKRNEEQAKLNARQAERNEAQEARNNEQVKRNEEQARRNEQQVELNALQARKNKEQAKLNEKQMVRNQELANKNQARMQE